MMQLYNFKYSGHSHRVRLFLSLLGIDYQPIHIDLHKKEQRDPEYLRLNPLGHVPTLVDGDVVISDSTAALVYLAKKYDHGYWLPNDPLGAAKVQLWLSTAAGELYRGPAAARAIKVMGRQADYASAEQTAEELFRWMQTELAERGWLAADHATIADVAMYSYIRVADEGELDIKPYPAILSWLESVESLEDFEPMPRRK